MQEKCARGVAQAFSCAAVIGVLCNFFGARSKPTTRVSATEAFASPGEPGEIGRAAALLGIEPTERGSLATGSGGRFASRTFRLEADGHGSLQALGEVPLETEYGDVRGGLGQVNW